MLAPICVLHLGFFTVGHFAAAVLLGCSSAFHAARPPPYHLLFHHLVPAFQSFVRGRTFRRGRLWIPVALAQHFLRSSGHETLVPLPGFSNRAYLDFLHLTTRQRIAVYLGLS